MPRGRTLRVRGLNGQTASLGLPSRVAPAVRGLKQEAPPTTRSRRRTPRVRGLKLKNPVRGFGVLSHPCGCVD